jgi:hypothetical protein
MKKATNLFRLFDSVARKWKPETTRKTPAIVLIMKKRAEKRVVLRSEIRREAEYPTAVPTIGRLHIASGTELGSPKRKAAGGTAKLNADDSIV